jgi:hypothetical protein
MTALERDVQCINRATPFDNYVIPQQVLSMWCHIMLQ